MRLIKLNGAGNLSGKVFYGRMLYVNPFYQEYILVELDEPLNGYKYKNPTVCVNIESGVVEDIGSDNLGENDLLTVSTHDLPRLGEFAVLSKDGVPSTQRAA